MTSPAVVRPAPRPAARTVLVCFSYCGGGTAPFRAWLPDLPPDVELAAVCPPGREHRIDEPYAGGWDVLVREGVGAVRELAGRRCVLFGHSLGARVAFQTAWELERSGGAVAALVVSGAESPVSWARTLARPPRLEDSDDELLGWLRAAGQLPDEVLADDELRDLALSLMRADLRAQAGYRYLPGTTVRAPIQVLYGTGDDDVDAAEVARWQPLTTGEFRAVELPGGHFYTDRVWRELPRHMSRLT